MTLQIIHQPAESTEAQIARLRRELQDLAVAYILGGTGGTRQDRLRLVSDLAGIPRRSLEAVLTKREGE